MKRVLLPISSIFISLAFWEWYVGYTSISKFVLPAPSAIAGVFVTEFSSLFEAAGNTLEVTLVALALSVMSGTLMAFLFSVSRTFESAVYPMAVILQVTPVVAIAPLVIIWVGLDNIYLSQVIIAWLVSFFPVLANMSAGLAAADKNLSELFTLLHASRWQRFWLLLWPTAMPYLLASLKVSGGLALIGGVVAEFVAGSGTASGLAWRIIEAGNRLQIEKMFAGLLFLMLIGVAIFYSFAALEKLLLRYRH